MLFSKDSRYKRGGFYRCRVKNAEGSRARYEANRDQRIAQKRDHYQAGGWIVKRRYDLDKQRARILDQLDQLHREEAALC
jgi:hypothetical protein